ncbi:hypothetical protein EGW08_012609, partial [Elysia chlorotica]
MDSALVYSCDYNPAGSTHLLTSNYLFLRPTDVDIFSAHFYLDRQLKLLPWADAIFRSLTNDWNFGLSEGPARAKRQSETTGFFIDTLQNILLQSVGFGLRPLEL